MFQAESTLGPVNEKSQYTHQESKPRPSCL